MKVIRQRISQIYKDSSSIRDLNQDLNIIASKLPRLESLLKETSPSRQRPMSVSAAKNAKTRLRNKHLNEIKEQLDIDKTNTFEIHQTIKELLELFLKVSFGNSLQNIDESYNFLKDR